MPLGDDVFRIHLAHQHPLPLENLHFVLDRHRFSDKIDYFISVVDIHLNRITPVLGRDSQCTDVMSNSDQT